MPLPRVAVPLGLMLGFAACTSGNNESAAVDSGGRDTGSENTTTGCYVHDPSGGFPEPDPCIDTVTYDCGLTTPNAWTYSVRTEMWADAGASLNIYQTGAWKEGATDANAEAWIELGHELSQGEEPGVDYGENGEWDQWGIALTITDTPSEVVPGTELKTLFGCDLYDNDASKAGVAWRLYVYDDDDVDPSTPGVPTDCWDFGFQPEEIPLMHEPDELCTIEE